MSNIANRRKFLEAAQALAKTNAPREMHYAQLLDALSAVATDDMGYPVLAYIGRDPVAEARARFGADAVDPTARNAGGEE